MTDFAVELCACAVIAALSLPAALAHGPDIALLLDDSRVAIAADTPSAALMPLMEMRP